MDGWMPYCYAKLLAFLWVKHTHWALKNQLTLVFFEKETCCTIPFASSKNPPEYAHVFVKFPSLAPIFQQKVFKGRANDFNIPPR